MKLSPHYLKRYKDISLLFLKHGQSGMVSKFGFDDEPEHPNGNDTHSAHELPDDLERMGPTFVKLGQLLSSRPDLLPPHYLKALSRLQDKVKPFPFEDVETIVESELGTKINKAFSRFDRVPLAAASLGQAHTAALHDGREVVVKVQRPNISKQIQEDFGALREIAKFMHRYTRTGQKYQLVKVLEEFEDTLALELDYKREAANMLILGKNLKEFPRIRVPRPVANYVTHKILTMDFIEGTKITELSPLARLDIDGCGLAEELFRAYLKQVVVDGFFHADPHPGNIFLTSDNQIALLDLGMVGHTTHGLQESLLKLLLAVSEGDSEKAADIAIRVSNPTDNFQEEDFRHKIARIVAGQNNAALGDMDIGKAILQLGRSAGETGLFAPMELTLLGKTLLQLDEVGRTLDPAFNPNDSIRRNAGELLNRKLKSSFTEGKLVSSLLETKHFFGALPAQLNKILDAVGNAELNVKLKPVDTGFLIESFHKVANRITTGLILAALIVGAALLMRVPTAFTIFGYPGLGMLCFMAAGGGGFWLVLSIVWQDYRSKRRNRR